MRTAGAVPFRAHFDHRRQRGAILDVIGFGLPCSTEAEDCRIYKDVQHIPEEVMSTLSGEMRAGVGMAVFTFGVLFIGGCRTGFESHCSSERIIPVACMSSAPDELTSCERLYDAVEFESPPRRAGIGGGSCDPDGDSTFCVYDSECTEGCIRDAWIRFDFGSRAYIDRIRYMADWWSKRPDDWELWVSDDPDLTPDHGATRVVQGVGMANPWVCEEGESCADASVPDACCPGGRQQPQSLIDVGPNWPRFDELEFDGESGRYWYYVIRNTRDPNNCLFFELELFEKDCT